MDCCDLGCHLNRDRRFCSNYSFLFLLCCLLFRDRRSGLTSSFVFSWPAVFAGGVFNPLFAVLFWWGSGEIMTWVRFLVGVVSYGLVLSFGPLYNEISPRTRLWKL